MPSESLQPTAQISQPATNFFSVLHPQYSGLYKCTIYCLLFAVLMACTPQLPNPANVTAVTAVPTLDNTNPQILCQTVEAQTGRNFELLIYALQSLAELNVVCADGITIGSQLYTAYLGYGTQLEQQGKPTEALQAYSQALQFDPQGQEAAVRLQRLQVATPIPPERCENDVVTAALQAIKPYTPTEGNFVRIIENNFVLDNARFPVYGVNYYPRNTPFRLFLTETPLDVVAAELEIIKRSGINTLRIFLQNQNLFICPGNGAVPNIMNFQRLDAMIQTMAAQGFRIIPVLNDAADLTAYPLYDNPYHLVEQTRFIVERYRNEPAILAWDIRDKGDQDYLYGGFSRETVLTWLADTVRAIRLADPNHPVTAGWWTDAEATAPLVDFVSFQHYGEYQPLRQNIAILQDNTDKPILMAAVGYSTHSLDEVAQRNLLYQAMEEASNTRLAGWVIYMAFDYPRTVTCILPDCPGEEKDINRFGIWNTSYFPKLAVEAVMRVTGVEQ